MRTKNKTKTMTYAEKFAMLSAGTDFCASGDGTQEFESFRDDVKQCQKVCIAQDTAMYLARVLKYACEQKDSEVIPQIKEYIEALQADASKINKADTIHLLDELANCWRQIKESTYTYRFLCVLARCVQ